LLSLTLSVKTLYGTDVYVERYYAVKQLIFGRIKLSAHQVSGCIGATLLPSIITIITRLDVDVFYRVIEPLLRILIVINVYICIKRIHGELFPKVIYMISSLLVVFHPTFVYTLTSAPRQSLALILFTSMLLLLSKNNYPMFKRTYLSQMILCISIPFYHYAVALLTAIIILMTAVLKIALRKFFKTFQSQMLLQSNSIMKHVFSGLLIIAVFFSWYMYTLAFAGIANNIKTMMKIFEAPEQKYLSIILPIGGTLSRLIHTYINLTWNAVIVVGLLRYLVGYEFYRTKADINIYTNASEDVKASDGELIVRRSISKDDYLCVALSGLTMMVMIFLFEPISKYGLGRYHLQLLLIIVPWFIDGSDLVLRFLCLLASTIHRKHAVIDNRHYQYVFILTISALMIINLFYIPELVIDKKVIAPFMDRDNALQFMYMDVKNSDFQALKFVRGWLRVQNLYVVGDYFSSLSVRYVFADYEYSLEYYNNINFTFTSGSPHIVFFRWANVRFNKIFAWQKVYEYQSFLNELINCRMYPVSYSNKHTLILLGL